MRGRWRSVGLAVPSALLVFTWSSASTAGGGQPQGGSGASGTALALVSPGCFTSGSGASFMKVCVSSDGTITGFQSPSGYEHINVGVILEGYRICEGFTTPHGYDAGGAGESGFGASTVTQPNGAGTFPLTITRDTLDGVFRLTQTFARDTVEHDFRITMTLKNLSGATRNAVGLGRFFDGDIDGDDSDDVYDFSNGSVWGRDDNALSLSTISFAMPHGAYYQSYGDLSSDPGSCSPVIIVTPHSPTSPGDWTGTAGVFLGNLASGASKTAKFVYRAF